MTRLRVGFLAVVAMVAAMALAFLAPAQQSKREPRLAPGQEAEKHGFDREDEDERQHAADNELCLSRVTQSRQQRR